jgi:hypothetical protein
MRLMIRVVLELLSEEFFNELTATPEFEVFFCKK